MGESLGSRFRNAIDAFKNGQYVTNYRDLGEGNSVRTDRPRFSGGNDQSIVTSIYNRIALSVAAIDIKHVKLDDNGKYAETIESGLNYCINTEANLDQTGRAFIQDVVISMLDEGSVAIVPVDTTTSARGNDITSLRTGKIIQWYPQHVRVRIYNDETGKREDITVPKSSTAIIENPLYAIINERNSTAQRLIHKLNLLDVVDEQSSSGKLNLVVQLPYAVRGELKKKQAEERRLSIEEQLAGTKYGIAYTDATEKITQLNRAVDNNMMAQIEYLTNMLYSQLGITQSILDGSANAATMFNYYNATVEPFLSAIVCEMRRKFLTKTARSQKQSIMFVRDPFKQVSMTDIAEIADKLTRNEIVSSNEIRHVIGLSPSSDPKADELRNKNITEPENQNGEPDPYDDSGV